MKNDDDPLADDRKIHKGKLCGWKPVGGALVGVTMSVGNQDDWWGEGDI
jgi:hypothetical protein